MKKTNNRGQGFTLEGFLATVVILSAVLFTMSGVAITPLSSSTSNERVQSQQKTTGNTFLVNEKLSGDLKDAILYWNVSSEGWYNTGIRESYTSPPNISFGNSLDRVFGDNGVAYSVNVKYHLSSVRGNNSISVINFIDQGVPTTNAIIVKERIILFDDDKILKENGSKSNVSVSQTDNFYAPDASPTKLYNIITIEVILWKI